MEDPTQPMFPVSEPESISAPQEPVIVTDPTPHTKKKKHNGDCMGSQDVHSHAAGTPQRQAAARQNPNRQTTTLKLPETAR